MDNRKNNGGHSTKGFAGRHSKSTEQEVIENLSLLDDLFFLKLEEALTEGKSWALRLFATHRIPKPKASIEVNNSAEQPLFDLIPTIKFVKTDGAIHLQ